jgi:hypothetical protein
MVSSAPEPEFDWYASSATMWPQKYVNRRRESFEISGRSRYGQLKSNDLRIVVVEKGSFVIRLSRSLDCPKIAMNNDFAPEWEAVSPITLSKHRQAKPIFAKQKASDAEYSNAHLVID